MSDERYNENEPAGNELQRRQENGHRLRNKHGRNKLAGLPRFIGKLTPELSETLVALIKAGAGKGAACRAVGIEPATMNGWRRRGRAAHNAMMAGTLADDYPEELARETEEYYAQFYQDINIALGEIESAAAGMVFKAGQSKLIAAKCEHCERLTHYNAPGDWKAVAHWLKAQFPQQWGDRLQVDISGQVQEFLRALEVEFENEPETFERILNVAIEGVPGGVRQDDH